MTSETAGATWDVTNLEVLEQEGGMWVPTQVVDQGEKFRLQATIEGSGALWKTYESGNYIAKGHFWAEGIGETPVEKDLTPTPVEVALGPVGGGPYYLQTEDLTIDTDGIYRCGVTVTFEDAANNPQYGTVGFLEQCLLQVSEFET